MFVLKNTTKKSKDRIAIIYAKDQYFTPKGVREIIGKDAIKEAFQEISDSKNIKAVVCELTLQEEMP